MENLNNSQKAFFELVKAGLWADQRSFQEFFASKASKLERKSLKVQDSVDWKKVHLLAQEQSVVGLVAAGIDIVQKVQGVQKFKVPQTLLLQWIGEVQVIEQRNKVMNAFVAALIDKLRKNDVYAILVKGQGIAQCYDKPLWRSSGDVDLLLSSDNYVKAKKVLQPLAIDVDTEYESLKHLGMTIEGGFVVELHGMMHSRLSRRIDRVIDKVQEDCFFAGHVRSEEFKSSKGSRVQVFLPSPDNDVIFVFTHILKHFYIEGIGLRQICDWCRLLWTYRESLNHGLLESRIKEAGLMTEWKAFAALAVEYLGMPVEAMPFYDVRGKKDDVRWKKKAEQILEFVIECGNFGHNRVIKNSNNFYIGKIQAAWFKMGDFARHAKLFPLDSFKFFWHYAVNGVEVAKEISMYKKTRN